MTRIFVAVTPLAVAACTAPRGQATSASASAPAASQDPAGSTTEPQARMHVMSDG